MVEEVLVDHKGSGNSPKMRFRKNHLTEIEVPTCIICFSLVSKCVLKFNCIFSNKLEKKLFSQQYISGWVTPQCNSQIYTLAAVYLLHQKYWYTKIAYLHVVKSNSNAIIEFFVENWNFWIALTEMIQQREFRLHFLTALDSF